MSIKGYKVFNPDWTCKGFQYGVGKTYKHNGDIKMCGAGFHFCQKASDCFNYYRFDSNNKVAEVEAIGVVETEGIKSVTDKITIVREIKWHELLDIVNEGKNCTGFGNIGDCNTGDSNVGNCNTGNFNIGEGNVGEQNTGNWNTGSYNVGKVNVGYYNIGDYNTGSNNVGDWNTGDWNATNYSSGFFNTMPQQLIVFNKPLDMDRFTFRNTLGVRIIYEKFYNNGWKNADRMTDKEKAAHPEYITTGGCLYTVDFKAACQRMWETLLPYEREAVREIPNFDAEVFKEITGIEV